MRWIVETVLRQRAVVNVVFVLLAALGVATYLRLPVDAWPDVSLAEAWITTYWDGAGAEEVELLVTNAIEDEIEDLRGVDRIVSISAPGLSFIDLKFDEDYTDAQFEAAFNELRTALDRVADLPEDAEVPILQKLTTSEVYPLFQIAAAVAPGADPSDVPEIVLREVARDLKRELEAVPGVLSVWYSGYRDRELQVLVDRVRARRNGVDLAEVVSALRRTGAIDPAGSIDAPSQQGDGRVDRIRIRHDSEFDSRWDVLDAVVLGHAEGPPLRVRDIAEISFGFEDSEVLSRYNGSPAIVLNVAKDEASNSLALREACRETVGRVEQRAPRGVTFGFTADSTEVVRSRFSVLIENLFLGLVLVALVLWGLLGIRNALIAVLGIPFSFLVAVIFFPSFGVTINNLTLFGMVLVGGMLVDDAVVVLENIFRRIEEGESVREAVVQGASEVSWPVINAVATTSAAMLPLLLQTGVTGKFFSLIPKAVLLCLAASLFEVFFILPVHYREWGSRGARGERVALGARLRERLFSSLVGVYSRILAAFLRHRLAVLSVLVGGAVFLVGLVMRVPQDPWTSDFNAIMIRVDCDPSYSLEQTDAALTWLEKTLESFVEEETVESYSTTVGFTITTDGIFTRRPNVALILAELVDRPDIVANPERPLNRLRHALESAVAGQREHLVQSVQVFPPHDGPPLGRPVAVRVESDDYDRAREVAGVIRAELARIDGVRGIGDNFELGPLEYSFRIDSERASRFRLFPRDLGLRLRAANDGLVAGSYREDDEDVDVRVLYAEKDRLRPDDLLDLDLRTPSGELVRLEDVAELDVDRFNAFYYHHDSKRTVLVTAEVDSSVVTGPQVNERLRRSLEDIPRRYPGVRLHFGGEFEETHKSMSQQRQSLWLALILIYVLLTAQFRSYLQPFVVLATVPFGILGVLLGLYLRSQPFTIPTFIAIIGLAGVVVNESLVLVAFMNKKLTASPTVGEAILEGARQRLRPILITSLTTIANLLPLALGIGGVSKVWTPFAVSIVFGMSFGTLITLLITPVLYSFTAGRKKEQLTESIP